MYIKKAHKGLESAMYTQANKRVQYSEHGHPVQHSENLSCNLTPSEKGKAGEKHKTAVKGISS